MTEAATEDARLNVPVLAGRGPVVTPAGREEAELGARLLRPWFLPESVMEPFARPQLKGNR